MKKPASVKALEELGRVRLSEHFFMRDFLYSEVSNFYGVPNVPDYPDIAIETGGKLCGELLEPLYERFGVITVVSGYRSCTVNDFCNKKRLNCASNEANYAAHIWDYRDKAGNLGATASIIIHTFADLYAEGTEWQQMAWWIHDHLPYSSLCFFPKLAAFNITWQENPKRIIMSYVEPKGTLTKPGMENFEGDHRALYTSLMAE